MEKDLENKLCNDINTNQQHIKVCVQDCEYTFDKFLNKNKFRIIKDSSEWNTDKKYMTDIIGGMTPDIVIRSELSNENRIYIEVKETSTLNYNKEDSQIIRYFLHLLATSKNNDKDIQRAIILAAPKNWFTITKNKSMWDYFIEKYSDLAHVFNIKLGIIYL